MIEQIVEEFISTDRNIIVDKMQNSIDDTIKWATLFAKLQDSQDLKKLIQSELKANDNKWRERIEGLIKDINEVKNTSNENAPRDWFDGLRICREIINNLLGENK